MAETGRAGKNRGGKPGGNRLGEKNGKGYNIKVKVGRKLDRDVKYNPLLYRKK